MDEIGTIVEIIKNVLTSLAVIVGGIWTYILFVQKRQKYPRIEIKHQVTQKNLGNGKTLFHAIIEVDNIGDVFAKLEASEIRLLQVLPILAIIDKAVQCGEDPVKDGETEINWYQLGVRKLISEERLCEIEPGEKDTFHCDFVINDDVQSVMIYSYFQNEKKRKKELGWTCSTMHDIENDAMGGSMEEPKETKILKKIIVPEPDEDATKQKKPKSPSPQKPIDKELNQQSKKPSSPPKP
jgi:hypothetical protein